MSEQAKTGLRDRCVVAVAIPTFRRPRGLKRLLDALASIETPLAVIVADNDVERAEGRQVVAEVRKTGSFPHALKDFGVPERGIAQVRNALAAHAIASPSIAFVAMIDDDEWPEPTWIDALRAAQLSHAADVVGGPVLRSFETPVPSYIARANNYNVGSRPSGVTELVDATSNVMFKATLFRDMPGPWFDPFFALTGGEDKDFMMRLKQQGKRFAWSNEAPVHESLPVSRCNRRWALQRAYSTGNSDMLINLRRRPPGFGLLSESAKIGAALAVAGLNLSLFVWSPARRFEGQRLGARVGGKLAAVIGHQHHEYRTIHGT